jgi:predicted MFS family arabinose efflux permease
MASRVLIDVEPLRSSRDFRLLFAGQLVSMVGNQFTMVAIAFQVYSLTRSSLQVGAVSMAQLGPLVLGALIGGALGDSLDRRRVLLAASAVLSLTSGALALNATITHASVLAIYLVSAVAAGFGGVVSTACSAAVPSLVRTDQLTAAYASMQVADQVGMVAGPAVSGILIGTVGLRWVYGLDAATFVLSMLALLMMSPLPPASGAGRPGLGPIAKGIRYVLGRQVLFAVYLIDLNATVLGLPTALFPELARSVFHGGPDVLGYMYASPAAGALIGALTTGWLKGIRRRAWAVTAAVSVWGGVIVAFGFVQVLWAGLCLLALAGWADVISAVLRDTILQTSVSEPFRGRVTSVQMAVVEGGPRLGALESGAVAAAVSAQFSVVFGGLACVAGAFALTALLPGFRHYGDRHQSVGGPETGPG